MVVLFGLTTLFSGFFREARAARQRVHLHAAEGLSHDGRFEVAVDEYRNALTYGRSDPDVRLGLARALFRLGRVSEAWNHLIDLRAGDPTSAHVNRLLARIAGAQGRADEATSYYRSAIHGRWPAGQQDQRQRLRFELIELLESRGDNIQVVGELVELLREVPDDTAVKAQIGDHLLAAGAFEKAAAVFEDLTRALPADARAYERLGEAELGRSHYLSARTAFRRGLAIEPDDPAARRWLRLCSSIVDLDPSYGKSGARDRLDRSRELVARSLSELERCLASSEAGAAALPAPTRRMVERAAQQPTGRAFRRRPAEAVEDNVALAADLRRERLRVCPAMVATDLPLEHVLRKLDQ
jgi:tetratricopeptide (TPR) repeat protein